MKKIWFAAAIFILFGGVFIACSSKENLEKQKEQADAHRNLGEAHLREGNYTAALRELIKAESLTPDDYIIQDDLGLAYLYKGESDKAIYHFNKALAIKEDYAPARNNLGNAYAQKKEWDKAIEQYKTVTSNLLYATPQFAYSNLGLAYYHKKDYRASEKYYKEALKITPDFDRALWGLSKTYVATGRMSEAVETLEFAVEKHPENTSLLYELGNAYVGIRDYRKAYGAYIRVVQINPDSPLADRALREANRIKPLL